ncbi:hypothetical protein Tco_0833918, partial [Tanacetum coccineum]
VVVQNVLGRQNRGQGNNAWGAGTAGYGGALNRVRNVNPSEARQVKCGQDNIVDEDVDEQPAPTAQNTIMLWDVVCDIMKRTRDALEMYNQLVVGLHAIIRKHLRAFKRLYKEVKEIKENFEELEAEVDQHVVDWKHDEIERKNLLIANDNLIVDCLFKDVFHVCMNSELMSSYNGNCMMPTPVLKHVV